MSLTRCQRPDTLVRQCHTHENILHGWILPTKLARDHHPHPRVDGRYRVNEDFHFVFLVTIAIIQQI